MSLVNLWLAPAVMHVHLLHVPLVSNPHREPPSVVQEESLDSPNLVASICFDLLFQHGILKAPSSTATISKMVACCFILHSGYCRRLQTFRPRWKSKVGSISPTPKNIFYSEWSDDQFSTSLGDMDAVRVVRDHPLNW